MSLTFSITNYPTGINPISVAVGDLNGDGQLDLVTANVGGDPFGNPTPAGTISVLLGSGGGTFSAATPYQPRRNDLDFPGRGRRYLLGRNPVLDPDRLLRRSVS